MANRFDRDNERRKSPVLIGLLVVVGIAMAAALGFIVNYRVTQDRKEQEYIASLRQANEQETAAQTEEEKRLAEEQEQLAAADSFYQKLADGYSVDVLVVGDSIGTGAGATDDNHRWPHLLQMALTEKYGVGVNLANISMGDNTSYAGYARTMALGDGVDYDLVIICYGKADATNDISLYYESIIRSVKVRYPNASTICVKESSERNYPKKMENIQKLADRYGLPVVDTIAPFNAKNYDSLVTDDELPNDEGQKIYFETMMGVIDSLVEARAGFDEADIEPLNERVTAMDGFQSFPATSFTREGNTFTLSAPVQGIVLGIDYTLTPGDNSCDILIDGEKYVTQKATQENDASQRYILVANKWQDGAKVNAEKEIKVVFSEDDKGKEQANGFMGLIVSGTTE